MPSNGKNLIAVIGATGHQGGAVVRALRAASQFKVRALSRNPASIATWPTKSSRLMYTARTPLNMHLKGHMAYFSSPIFGKKVPTNASRQPRRYTPPRLLV